MATIKDRYILDIDVQGAVGGIGNLQGALGRIGGGAVAAGVAGIGVAIAAIGTAAIQSAKQFETYNNQLRLITTSQTQLTEVMGKLNSLAVQNRAAFGDTVDLFSKLTLATDGMGKSQEDVLEVTSRFQQALALSGADANTAGAAIRQFGQAMASGTVRGDEFNSIVEALGPALIIMARESGKTVGELRAMSQAGELTADVFFELVQNSDALGAAFGKTQKTIADLEQEVADAAGKMLASMAEGSGLADAYRIVLESLARGMRDIAGAQTDLESTDVGNIFAMATKGTISYDEALKELNLRLAEASTAISLGGRGVLPDDEKVAEYTAAIERLTFIQEQYNIESEKLQRIQRIANEDRARALRPIEDEMKAIDDYVISQAASTSELEKALVARKAVEEVILGLQEAVGTEAEKYVDLNGQMAIANAQHGALTEKINELTGATAGSSFGNYYDSLVSGATKSAESADFAIQAQSRLIEELNTGKISLDTYAFAIDSLNLSMESEAVQTYATYMADLNQSVTDTVAQTGFQNSAINELNQKYLDGTINIDFYRAALDSLGTSFDDQMIKTNNLSGYMDNLMSQIDSSIQSDQFKSSAVGELSAKLESGSINLEQYTKGMEMLGQTTNNTADSIKDSADAIKDSNSWMADLQRSTADAQLEFDNLGMNKLDQDISRSSNKIKNELSREIEALQEIQNTANYDVIQSQIDALTTAADTAIETQSELARKSNEYQRSFAYGWNEAFSEYADSATNAASQARKIFQTTTQGMEDLIVNFAKTGKFEWKGFVSDILETTLRSNVQQLIGKTFSPGGILGGLGGLLGGTGGGEAGAGRGQSSASPLFVYDTSNGPLMGQGAAPGGVSSNPFSGLFNGISNLFSGGGGGGAGGGGGGFFSGIQNALKGVGKLFGGFFATGGMIPPGRFGVVGENGRELVSGPATVTPMQASQVIYNISAVDAMSFKQMIARDPGFIHAVAQQGSRKLPVRG